MSYLQQVVSNPAKYKALPVKRIDIPKPGTNKTRPLGIPCISDRAVQALYGFALQPIADITCDQNSFG